MKKAIAVFLCVAMMLIMPGSALAVDVLLGKCTANLSSAVSNNYSVSWYTIGSPYYPYSYGIQEPPSVLLLTSENAVKVKMDYQMRDNSMVKGKSQAVNMEILHWDPGSYSWISEGSVGKSKGSATYGRYNMTGTMDKQTWWGSSTKIVKYQVKADAKSGDTKTSSRYFWAVRQPTNYSDAYKAGPRYICSRYDRSALYKELGKTWRELGISPTGSGVSQGLDNIINISKGFVVPTKQDMAVQAGIDAFGVANVAWNYSSVTAEVTDSAGIIYQGFTWVMTAINLLGPGLKDSIMAATAPTITKQAASAGSSLATQLETVANATRDEGFAMMGVIYGTGSVYTWQQKLQEEKTAIENALSGVTYARGKVAEKCDYSYVSGLGYGVGSGTQASANAVKNQLDQYLNGVEDQLKYDQALVNKAINVANGS